MQNKNVSRRKFLRNTSLSLAGVIGFPHIIPSRVLGRNGVIPPSEKINVASIGTGHQGLRILRSTIGSQDAHLVAVCDVDSLKRQRTQNVVNEYYANLYGADSYKGCDGYNDFRELLAREDIDAVLIATPDHWHSDLVASAAKAGKDIYCEKPLSLTIKEGRDMVNYARRYNIVFQTGSHQRSSYEFRFACELVRNGYIGELKKVGFGYNPKTVISRECDLPAEPVPDYLDWNMWLGPAPWRPYHSILSPHVSVESWHHWRDYRDYSAGKIADWGAHHFDIIQWALDMDSSGPVEIIPPDGKKTTAYTYKYANGVPLIYEVGDSGTITFTGSEGSIRVRRGSIETTPSSLRRITLSANDIHLYKSTNHYQNWLDCIRTRERPICDVEIGCRSVTVCHIGNIAHQVGRPLKWDPRQEEFVDDQEANRYLSRKKRDSWKIA